MYMVGGEVCIWLDVSYVYGWRLAIMYIVGGEV